MYAIEPLDLSDAGLSEASSLLRHVFPDATQLTPTYLDWLYRRNPAGPAVGFNAMHDGVPVAHFAAIPFPARVHGELGCGLLALNLAAHPEHRGQRLASRVGHATVELAQQRGLPFFIAVVNGQSTHLFVETLRFTHLGHLDARLGLGPLPRPAADADVAFERTWDEASVRWRLENPGRDYRLVRRGRDVQVRAATGRLGIEAVLAELPRSIVDGPVEERAAWRPTLWLGIDAGRRWRPSTHVDLPMRARPSPLNFVYLDPTGRGRGPRRDEVRFRGLDFDAY